MLFRSRRYLDDDGYGRAPEREPERDFRDAPGLPDDEQRYAERSERQVPMRRYSRDEGPLDVEPLPPRDIGRDPW